jgi:hypothetical protein
MSRKQLLGSTFHMLCSKRDQQQQLNALSINPQYYTGDSKVNYSALFNINSYIIGSQDWYENNQ